MEIGEKKWKLTLEKTFIDKWSTKGIFKCDCGKYTITAVTKVNIGHTKSCGCLNIEATKKSNTTHGMRRTSIYRVWSNMKDRCLRGKNRYYKDYGGRGIKVCDKWLKFEGFFEDMGEKPEGLTLDRIDNDGDYSKENCRWATKNQQANNCRSNLFIEYLGEKKTIGQVAILTGIKYATLRKRIVELGWDINKAIKNRNFAIDTRFKKGFNKQ